MAFQIHIKVTLSYILNNLFYYFQALSAISKFLTRLPSPFNNLKYVKLPRGCEQSSLCTIKSYFLGGSPRAIIVTTLPKVQKSICSTPLLLTLIQFLYISELFNSFL